MNSLHHSVDPRLWNFDRELRLLGFGAPALSRRAALKLGLLGAAGLALGPRAASAPAAPPPALPAPRAKSVIQIWLWGGPCHLDTFDPKPDAGYDYYGALKTPLATNVPGIQIGELLPLLAQQADKYALLRGMTHGSNGHETAAYTVQTGRPAGGRDVFPGAGAVVSLFKGYDAGYKGLLPPYVVLTELQGRFSESGFLGGRYKPFATGGDPGANRFLVEGVVSPGLTDERQRSRREFLHRLNLFERALPATDPRLAALGECERDAYEMILGDAGKVFDLGQETDAVRDRYGRTTFGQSCLMARRLVERGVPYVTINYKGWDTHKQHFPIMRRKLPELDRGLATLLADLAERGLLDQTIVWAGGEFGRTPKVSWESPWNGGRGHWGKAFSTLVAGGGFKGGQVIGKTDARGEEVVEQPVHPSELIARVYQQLGIPGDARLPHPEGRDVRTLPTAAEAVPSHRHLASLT
ncbi:MAG: hypothetical protein B9S34_06395 [Opitutia bacterium Tous-C1TDCM]|nr:MAG: hypothetical protein B9S34_06395 [Opitutae bacterium Tous-C1TDCM]